MIRHPVLRCVQLAGVLAQALLALVAVRRAHAEPAETSFALTVLGERELPDGSWQGVDLLATPGAASDRVQLGLTPAEDVRVELAALDDSSAAGARTVLFPRPGERDLLRRGQSYALPAPGAFYALRGSARLLLTVTPLRQRTPRGPQRVRPEGPQPGDALPLSDGAPFRARVARCSARGAAEVEVSIHD